MKSTKTHKIDSIKKHIAGTLLCALALLPPAAAPASAAIQRSADFSQGQTVGLGLYGLSYDYGIGFFSAGLSAQSPASLSLGNPLNSPLKPGLRLAARFFELEGLSAAVIGGLLFDPGRSGERAYLTPDLGMGIAYDFRKFNFPFALRMNLTLALSDSRNSPIVPVYGDDYVAPAGNFFQRLSFGPQTSFELAWLPTDQLEVTLGGGTLLGMRMKF